MTLERNNLFSGTAPEQPGIYSLEIDCRQKWRPAGVLQGFSREERGEEETRIALMVIVLHPFSRVIAGFMDQYPIGVYPNPEEAPANLIPKPGFSSYLPPKGFIQLNSENQGVFVSRHYRLQDFACRFKAPFPQYLAISTDLLLKLELLTLKLKSLGNPETRLTITSGFRTPWYNQTVSGALWSRHLYGDAADIIVDVSPQDGLMDDLNQDGRINRDDALLLARLIEEIEEETGLPGGLGIYDWGNNGEAGPFVHIDTRGFKARW